MSKLERALTAALSEPGALAQEIDSVVDEEVRSAREAELVVRVLRLLPTALSSDDWARSPLHQLVEWMQSAEDEAPIDVFKRLGAPELLRIFDEGIALAEAGHAALEHDLPFLIKVACLYQAPGGARRVAAAARSVALRDSYLWSGIFEILANERHRWGIEVLEHLRSPLPEGFAGVAYLDFANALARGKRLIVHPFASSEGARQLERWLSDPDKARFSYAHSATAALPFVDAATRERLMEVADAHPSDNVRLEAAWAAAACGDERGIARLQKTCADPRWAYIATAYLQEIGAAERIPVHTRSPAFRAISEMCRWLAHPQEYGRPPERIEQADVRDLYWPPTDDVRTVWLFRYEYAPRDPDTKLDSGYGMVGSVTFALMGETTADKSPEEVYGMHCAWELQTTGDDRAPAERSAEAGMRILREYNPGFGSAPGRRS